MDATFDPATVADTVPEFEPSAGFDFAEVERALGESTSDLEPGDNARLGVALRRLVQFILRPRGRGQLDAHQIGVRFAALAWLVDPTLLDGRSLRLLAKELGESFSSASRESAAARREFNLCNGFSSHGNHNFRK